ncbi:zinc finger protein hit domain-containing protein [Cyclospora cayetanensis]|uniref:Zinc finger protein hit domain-containing protein n=1 Tax=Cyclospora cayetanensis TaxID=88456 RepID=A0A1D3D524_9EIME|nr:zinc finger protein hit domain-containing protein [Cyclospora cayetanensis]
MSIIGRAEPGASPDSPCRGPPTGVHRGQSFGEPGAAHGRGYRCRGNGNNTRTAWFNSGGPYLRLCGASQYPRGASVQRGSQRMPRGAPGGTVFRGAFPSRRGCSQKLVCGICGEGEGVYRFRCCRVSFCSCACYKEHTSRPCQYKGEQQPQQKVETATYCEASEQKGACEAPQTVEVESPASAATTGAVSQAAVAQADPSGDGRISLSSPDNSSVAEKSPSKRRAVQHTRGAVHHFPELSAAEEAAVRSVSSCPELQSASVRDAVSSVVTALSRGPFAALSVFEELLQDPSFAAFVHVLSEALHPDSVDAEKCASGASREERIVASNRNTQRCTGEQGPGRTD